MQNGNSVKKHVHALFFVRFSNVYEIVYDMIAFRNPYLVKSVNLAFTHVFFQSVYHDVAPSNVKVKGQNCLRRF